MWYNYFVQDKSLIETNPYLRDPKEREKFVFINVTSSTAVELGKLPSSLIRALKDKSFPSLIKLDETEESFSPEST